MKQTAVRIGGFVVNAGSQTIVLDRNVDVEKSNARSGNFPGKLESRMKSIDKLDESVELVGSEKIKDFSRSTWPIDKNASGLIISPRDLSVT